MYDSTAPGDIPLEAKMVAGYVDGPYAWPQSGWARFPDAVKVRIAIAPWTDDGEVLDVEQYDASPQQAPGWVQLRRRSGADPTVYCSRSAWPTVWSEFQRQGVPQPHYWIAQYDNVAALPSGAVAKQYIDPPQSGGHWDLSLVADFWPGVDAAPPAPAPPDTLPVEMSSRPVTVEPARP